MTTFLFNIVIVRSRVKRRLRVQRVPVSPGAPPRQHQDSHQHGQLQQPPQRLGPEPHLVHLARHRVPLRHHHGHLRRIQPGRDQHQHLHGPEEPHHLRPYRHGCHQSQSKRGGYLSCQNLKQGLIAVIYKLFPQLLQILNIFLDTLGRVECLSPQIRRRPKTKIKCGVTNLALLPAPGVSVLSTQDQRLQKPSDLLTDNTLSNIILCDLIISLYLLDCCALKLSHE